ncbi:hypothetical protein [Mycobacterium spongiae]|uniref:Uncharacterized protein n=1 Tax=Mycobacterium spongiae TaxID=886343 RepID=A0A975K142_9MYCO|nr:hypothetical protein [Mycobacterium spongiae]QUR69437.1 hypothetical protein F6B93_22275 [Mycobacterium spongiae]
MTSGTIEWPTRYQGQRTRRNAIANCSRAAAGTPFQRSAAVFCSTAAIDAARPSLGGG